MLFLRFEEISYAVGYLATLTFPLLYLKSWQEHGTYNTKRKIFLNNILTSVQYTSLSTLKVLEWMINRLTKSKDTAVMGLDSFLWDLALKCP